MRLNIKPLISICIPTFNRSRILANSLESLINQDFFINNQYVEVIVSDNSSNDDTEIVCKKYLEKYPGKFFYYKNATNIGDKNFQKSLSYGSGEFLKLSNDSLCYKHGSLQHMVELIKKNIEKKPVLFFLNNGTPTPNRIYKPKNPDDFISKVSYFVTSIACFGIWRVDFDKLVDFNRRSDLQLTQVDVLFRLLSEPNRQSLVDNKYLFGVQDVGGKGGYGLFNVFVENYFYLLDQFSIKTAVRNKEKRRILLNHVALFDAESVYKNSFLKEDRFKILIKNSKNIRFIIPIYYLYYLAYLVKFFIKFKLVKNCFFRL
jgi:abequosyltransferase